MAAETPLRFEVDGTEYEVPEIDDLDMDEWQLIYEYSGLLLDDFAPFVDDEEAETERRRRVAQPAFTRALLHIGYQRSHPDAKPAEVKKLTGAAKMVHVLEALGEQTRTAEDDAGPPESTTVPDPSSPRSAVASNASS